MGIVTKRYLRDLVCRYDKEVGIPYYAAEDFKGLHEESYVFTNSKGNEVHYFYYYYDGYKTDKILLFCSGIGCGHIGYLAEINCLAKRGYKVLTLDYTGCGESKGECLGSLNMPTLDVMDLLAFLKIDKPLVIVGHSLGGYTALNLSNIRNDVLATVAISPFLSIESIIFSSTHSKFVTGRVLKYEQKILPQFFGVNNVNYLKKTKDRVFIIQSDDDPIIPYVISLKVIEEFNNPSIKTFKVTKRKHNPNYLESSVSYMNATFSRYRELIKHKDIITDEDKVNYFKDISLEKLTEQDEKMFDEIVSFIENK